METAILPRLTTYELDRRVCATCGDSFIFSHSEYKPKFKLVPVENDKPKMLVYCSEACLQSIPKDTCGPCGCDMRSMAWTEGRKGEKWACLKCAIVFLELPEEVKA